MDRYKKVIVPILIFGILLLLAMLGILWYLNNQCLTSTNIYRKVVSTSVLGITTFGIVPDKTTVNGGDPAQFTITNNLDSVLAGGTMNFSLTGGGKFTAPPTGPGTCTLVSETEATCESLNLNPNQENQWSVSILSDEDCLANSTLTLNSTLNSLLGGQIGTQSESIGCTPATTTPTETGNNGSNNTTNTSTTSVTTTTLLDDEDSDITLTTDESILVKRVLDRHNAQVGQCLTTNTISVGGGALLIYILFWLLILFYLMKGQDTKVVEVRASDL